MCAAWFATAIGVLGLATPAAAQGGFFGKWFYQDGSQAYNARAVAGAAPNPLATAAGVRCEYRYVNQNGQRVRYEICE
jgi:hypothetical protein